MATAKRQADSHLDTAPLRERLFREFHRFSFFKAVNLLLGIRKGAEALGDTLEPGKEAVRFSVKPDLSFPAADITGL
ncbi:MAG TPA: type VI secretion system baseplate subunit TssG, partial [Desulfomonilia bacterium]|nr:type VI secretion system baseplate subunit TssG [Desulfomonilia bacterium]